MTTKYCQNRLCHYYNTTDRLRAKKSDNPYYVTRTARNYLGMFCSQGCLYEYFDMYKDRILIAIGEQGKRRRKKSDQNLWDSWRQQPEYNLNWDEGYHEARVRFTREWIRENVKE